MAAILRLVTHNMRRWRWRIFCVAALLALSFIIYILYAAGIEVTSQATLSQVEPLYNPYVDVMVALQQGQPLVNLEIHSEDLGWTPYGVSGLQRWIPVGNNYVLVDNIPEIYAPAIGIKADSDRGEVELLGLEDPLAFYTIPEKQLQGRFLANDGELLLPRSVATRMEFDIGENIRFSSWQGYVYQTGILHRVFTLVGIYDDDDIDLAPGLVHYSDAQALQGSGDPNRFLINYNRETSNLSELLAWMRAIYPNATLFSNRLPEELGQSLLRQHFRSGSGIRILIFLFASIGALTVVILTFFERRKEIASLKALGATNKQISVILILEQGIPLSSGLLTGIMLLGFSFMFIPWLSAIPASLLFRYAIAATGQAFFVSVIALVFPLLTIRAATVDQLLYARRIPLLVVSSDHLERDVAIYAIRERIENVRFLLIPPWQNASIFLLHHQGDNVKKGEIIAVYEEWFGYSVKEFRAFCDSRIIEMNEGGLIVCQPHDPDEVFYPYPREALDLGRRSLETIERHVLSKEQFTQRQEAVNDAITVAVSRVAPVKDKPVEDKPPSVRKNILWSWRWRWPILGVALLALFYVDLNTRFIERHQHVDMELYSSYELRLLTIKDEISATGNLVARQSETMQNTVAGRIAEVFVADGDKLQRGQPLLCLANPLLLLNLKQAEENLAEAQLRYDTLRLLSEGGAETLDELGLQALALRHRAEGLQRQTETLQVVAPVDGVIGEVKVRVGDEVSAGAELFGLYDSMLSSEAEETAQLLRAKAAWEESLRELEKLSVKAADDGVVAEIAVTPGQGADQGELLLRVTSDSSASSEQELLLTRAISELEELDKRVQELRPRAPHAGRISQLKAQPGGDLADGTQYALLSDDSELICSVAVPQSKIVGVELGRDAEIFIYSVARRYTGRVSAIAVAGEIDATTLSVSFEVQITLKNDGNLAPGMGCGVTLVGELGQEELSGLRGILQPYRTEELEVAQSGKVIGVHVANGAWVVEGQPLLELENLELELAYRVKQQELAKLLQDEYLAEVNATVAQIMVRQGEHVTKGQELLRLNNELLVAESAAAKREYERLLRQEATNTTIKAGVSGTVATIYAHKGDKVVAGQPLAELSNTEAIYQAQYAETEARLAAAAHAAAQLNPDSGALRQAEVILSQARTAWEQSRLTVERLTISASCDGTITLLTPLYVEAELPAYTSLAKISGENEFLLKVQIDESEIARLDSGCTAEVTLPAFDGEVFTATLRDTAREGQITESGGVFEAVFVLQGDARVRPGMTAYLAVVLRRIDFTLAIPREYLYYALRDGEPVPMVDLLQNGRVIPTQVSTGLITKEMAEITNGLRERDVVLMKN